MTAEPEPPPAAEPEGSQKPSRFLWWVLGSVLALVGVVGAILYYGYTARPGWVGVSDKKFWNYLELLIVPAVIAMGVGVINWMQSVREQRADALQRERDRERFVKTVEADRARALEVESQRAQDEALQYYLDQMSQLLVDYDRPLRQSQEGDEVRQLARARTLMILRRLDGNRKGDVVRFLYESGLIFKDRSVLDLHRADLIGVRLVADLNVKSQTLGEVGETDLHEVDLHGAVLREADLRLVNLSHADMREANLRLARMANADLSEANLSGAYLVESEPVYAVLRGADLSHANLSRTVLEGATLVGADLSHANLTGADLYEADLTNANLSGATLTSEQLESCRSLQSATMPDGSQHP